MEIRETEIPEVKVLIPRRFSDERGSFCETWNARRMVENGLDFEFVQDNQSYSASVGTVRGLHYQSPPMAQAKLVRVVSGEILDVAVDVRRGSPTWGHWVAQRLSAERGDQMLIPRGFLHGFATLTPDTDVIYKCDGFYAPECDGAVRFDDEQLGIDWGIDANEVVLSAKDAAAPKFRDFESPFDYRATLL